MEQLKCFIGVTPDKNSPQLISTLVVYDWGFSSRSRTSHDCSISEEYLGSLYDLLLSLSQFHVLVTKFQQIQIYVSDLAMYSWMVTDVHLPLLHLEQSQRIYNELKKYSTIHGIPFVIKYIAHEHNIALYSTNKIVFKPLNREEIKEVMDGFTIKSQAANVRSA